MSIYSSTSALLLASSLLLSGCAPKVGEVARLDDETTSEAQAIAQDGTGTQPANLPLEQDQSNQLQSASVSEDKILAKYAHLDPKHEVSTALLKKAVLYFDAHQSKIANKNYLSVIDFSLRSTLARFFIIDMKTGEVWAIHVAHGKGTDPDHDGYASPSLFSNKSGSNASSLGFYLTAETYSGTHGLSLRLDGLSTTNSNVRARAIVIHGATYVQEAAVIQGRSLGCPAVSMGNRDEVVGRLKGGALIYAGLSSAK